MTRKQSTELVRALGRWSLAALVINTIIGSGIFGLPSAVAGLVGRWSPLAYVLAAAGIGVIMACFAEVSSQYREAGGPYLYVREAFGRFLGIQTGWLIWLVRLTAAAANANLFVIYLAEFWPRAGEPLPRLLVLTVLVGGLAVVNCLGVKAGAQMSNVFTVAKLLPLLLFIGAGLFFLSGTHALATPAARATATSADWFKAALLLVFAYGGFEAALIPMSEARDPRHDAPFALGVALVSVTVMYTLIQLVVIGALKNPAASDRPLATAAHVFLGPGGAALVAAGALISVYGYLSANLLHTPRITFALSERGDFPAFFSFVHPRFRTPYVSILAFAGLVWALAVGGSFQWNVLLSAVARLFAYGLVCAALPALRRKQPRADAYRLPAGNVFAGLGVGFMLVLVTRMDRGGALIVGVTVAIALLNWLWVRRRPETTPAA